MTTSTVDQSSATGTTVDMPVTVSSPDTGDKGGADKPLWLVLLKMFIGAGVVIGALAWSESIAEPIERFGYVPVMFCYVLLMIIGGGLMVSGFLTLWRRVTSGPSDGQ